MICMKYDHNKKFGLLKFHSGYDFFYLYSPKSYRLKIINAQTVCNKLYGYMSQFILCILYCSKLIESDLFAPLYENTIFIRHV